MKAIMRTCTVAREDTAPYCQVIITRLTSVLTEVCRNPSHPTFNHYLFETIAALIRFICSVDANKQSYVTAFETMLLSPFQHVLQNDVAEFIPYVFQIFCTST